MKAPPPPLFVSYASLEEVLEAMPSRFRDGIRDAMQPIVERGLPPALSVGVVATLFGVSIPFVRAISKRPDRYYREFTIRKGKKERKISAPKVALKLLQSWLGSHLANSVILADCVYGFVPGRNGVIEAARHHSKATWVYSLDLRDFFPNVGRERVESALVDLGYSRNSALFISSLCTLNGGLPQGSPASPVLSNIAFACTDAALCAIATDLGVRYTRYADDLVFSGDGALPSNLQEQVRVCLSSHKWEIAPEKEKVAELPRRLKVHGLLVHGEAPRLTKGYRNRIRAYRHLLSTGKIAQDQLERVTGHLSYAKQVEDAADI